MLDRAYLDAVVRPDPEGHPRRLTEEQKEEAMINALRSIALLGDRAQIPGLRRIGDADPSLRVRAAAIESLRSLASGPSY